MIVRDIEDARGTGRDVRTPNWASVRLLLKSDGMGFSLHETTIFPGTETYMTALTTRTKAPAVSRRRASHLRAITSTPATAHR